MSKPADNAGHAPNVVGNGTEPTGTGPADTGRGAPRRGRAGTTVSRTRISGIWASAIVATLLLVVLLVFILQNTDSVTVEFFGLSGALPLGVSMLLSAVAGALLVALLGAARILQLRRAVRRTAGDRRARR